MRFTIADRQSRRFDADDRGSIAILFAVVLTVVVLGGGIALDYARGIAARADMQSAADSAVLAAVRAKSADGKLGHGQLKKIAKEYFERNFSGHYDIDKFKLIDAGNGGYRVEVTAELKTTLTGITGLANMSLNISSTAATSQNRPLELALVLDNTGSMWGNKLSSLKKAANDLLDTLLEDNINGDTRIALVPFGMYVNVGPANANAAWMNVADPAKWTGCVGSRNHPRNTEDASYATDRIPALEEVSCGLEITPLTGDAGTLKGAVNDMSASGWTYIPSGLSWGWRVLSSEAPFTEGRTAADLEKTGGIKAIVLMTDGENTRSPTYPDHTGWDTDLANALTGELCVNVKSDRVVVYTIAFEVTDALTKDLLKKCASEESYYYDAGNAGELAQAFDTIAGELKQLRLTH